MFAGVMNEAEGGEWKRWMSEGEELVEGKLDSGKGWRMRKWIKNIQMGVKEEKRGKHTERRE